MTDRYSHLRKKTGGRPPIIWTSAYLQLLGKIKDIELAKIIGCSSTTVLKKRKELNIPKYTNNNLIPDYIVPLLGTMTDSELSRRTGIIYRKIRLARLQNNIPISKRVNWTDDKIQLLGKIPDKELAAIVGTSYKVVANMRRKLQITAYTKSAHKKPYTIV